MSSEFGAVAPWDKDTCSNCYMTLDRYGDCPVCDWTEYTHNPNDEEE